MTLESQNNTDSELSLFHKILYTIAIACPTLATLLLLNEGYVYLHDHAQEVNISEIQTHYLEDYQFETENGNPAFRVGLMPIDPQLRETNSVFRMKLPNDTPATIFVPLNNSDVAEKEMLAGFDPLDANEPAERPIWEETALQAISTEDNKKGADLASAILTNGFDVKRLKINRTTGTILVFAKANANFPPTNTFLDWETGLNFHEPIVNSSDRDIVIKFKINDLPSSNFIGSSFFNYDQDLPASERGTIPMLSLLDFFQNLQLFSRPQKHNTFYIWPNQYAHQFFQGDPNMNPNGAYWTNQIASHLESVDPAGTKVVVYNNLANNNVSGQEMVNIGVSGELLQILVEGQNIFLLLGLNGGLSPIWVNIKDTQMPVTGAPIPLEKNEIPLPTPTPTPFPTQSLARIPPQPDLIATSTELLQLVNSTQTPILISIPETRPSDPNIISKDLKTFINWLAGTTVISLIYGFFFSRDENQVTRISRWLYGEKGRIYGRKNTKK